MERIEGTIEEKVQVTDRLGLFRIDPEEIPDFTPGQFMMIGLDIDGDYKKRAYSIVSAPFEDGFMDFCIKAAPEGKGEVAPHILERDEGDKLKLEGPYGKFTLNGGDRDKLFIAAGTGIAPMMSMVRTITSNGFSGDAQLFYGASYPNHLVYSEELEEHDQENNNFTFIPTVSREAPGWTGEEGRVEEVFPDHLEDVSGKEAYLCGPPPMVDNCIEILTEMGMDEEDIHKEKYW